MRVPRGWAAPNATSTSCKAGDKIKFTAERLQGALTDTSFAKGGAAK